MIPPLILGPMAGVTDVPYRVLCRKMGADIVCGEMVSAKAVIYRNKNTDFLCHTVPEEKPVGLQLFGSVPDIMAEAARMIESDYDYDFLDINMGCPVPKIVKNGEGSALMMNPSLIEHIVDAVVRATTRPVTVKLRKGFSKGENTVTVCALAAEAGGASRVTVHGRTREDYYSGVADWTCIRDVKEALHIPVIASGDIKDGISAVRCLNETGADALMIARAAEGNPWIFNQIRTYFKTGETPPMPDTGEVVATLLKHAGLLIEYKGEFTGIREMRKHAAWYLKGMPHAARLRDQLSSIESYDELRTLCEMVG